MKKIILTGLLIVIDQLIKDSNTFPFKLKMQTPKGLHFYYSYIKGSFV